MIKINVVCVGKVKENYYKEAIAEYVKRLKRFCEVSFIECKDETFSKEPSTADILRLLKKEGEGIEKNLKGYIIALAIEGEKISSETFAKKLAELKDAGEGIITFVIGGSYGIDASIKQKADKKISFSNMTFPHTLARVLLLEQIYRAFMINADSDYHK